MVTPTALANTSSGVRAFLLSHRSDGVWKVGVCGGVFVSVVRGGCPSLPLPSPPLLFFFCKLFSRRKHPNLGSLVSGTIENV